MLRILHFADLHIGVENYGRPDPATGLSTRLLDFLAAFDELVECAVRERVDLVLFAGDAYKTREPSQTHQREFARRIRRLLNAGIPVYLLVGNHDLPNAAARANALEIFATLEVEGAHVGSRLGTTVIQTPNGPVQVVGVPWPNVSLLLSRDEYRNLSIDQVNQRVEEILSHEIQKEGEALDPSLPCVLTAHVAMNEFLAQAGSEQWMTVGHAPTILKSTLRPDLFDYVALGHHHHHQVLNERPPIVYAGSLQRVDFGEEKDEKGFCLVTLDPARPRGDRVTELEFRKVHARRFVTVSVSPRGEDPTPEVVEAIARAGVEDAVVRVQVRMTSLQESRFREAEVRAALAGAHYVSAVQKQVEQERRTRLAGDHGAERLAPLDALRLYLQSRETPPDYGEKLVDRAKRLIDAWQAEQE
ncbi:MAG TPA: exonuclease SbcCD subunit D [Dehalococcoidia bacterium]